MSVYPSHMVQRDPAWRAKYTNRTKMQSEIKTSREYRAFRVRKKLHRRAAMATATARTNLGRSRGRL